MKIGLLECDHIPEHFTHLAKDYNVLFMDLFPEFEFTFYDVVHGVFPKNLDECDAFICTGSRYSVYEKLEWIQDLKRFVKSLYHAKKTFVGVCFGHQMLGEALGGKVWKAPAGWNVGVHTFEIIKPEPWMEPFQSELNLLMMCQDQVLELPDKAVVQAKTDHCPVGIFTVGKHMLGIQAHPEFPKSYNKALMEDRFLKIGEEKITAGLESLNLPLHEQVIASWVGNFLNGNLQK